MKTTSFSHDFAVISCRFHLATSIVFLTLALSACTGVQQLMPNDIATTELVTPATVAVVEAGGTAMPSPVETPTVTPLPTPTPQPTATPTPLPTATLTPRLVATATPLPTPTFTAANGMGGAEAKGCTPFVDCVPTPAPASVALENTENILLMGSDLRAGDRGWNNDTLMLVAIDREKNRVGVLSFPRDLWVYLPGWGYDRINRPDVVGEYLIKPKHPGGGFGLVRDAFQYNFGIRVDHVARLHRQGFVDIVDALGGVDVELDCEVWNLSTSAGHPGFRIGGETYYVLYLPSGKTHLDGETALKFVTYRLIGNDYDRARRQQEFLHAFRQQFVRPDTLTEFPKLWVSFKDYFKTDVGFIDLIGLAKLAASMDIQSIHARVIDADAVENLKLPNSNAFVSTSKGNSVFQIIEGLFEAPPITSQSKPAQGCFRPKWADAYLQTLPGAPAPAPASTAQPVTPEASPEASPTPQPSPTLEATAQPAS